MYKYECFTLLVLKDSVKVSLHTFLFTFSFPEEPVTIPTAASVIKLDAFPIVEGPSRQM